MTIFQQDTASVASAQDMTDLAYVPDVGNVWLSNSLTRRPWRQTNGFWRSAGASNVAGQQGVYIWLATGTTTNADYTVTAVFQVLSVHTTPDEWFLILRRTGTNLGTNEPYYMVRLTQSTISVRYVNSSGTPSNVNSSTSVSHLLTVTAGAIVELEGTVFTNGSGNVEVTGRVRVNNGSGFSAWVSSGTQTDSSVNKITVPGYVGLRHINSPTADFTALTGTAWDSFVATDTTVVPTPAISFVSVSPSSGSIATGSEGTADVSISRDGGFVGTVGIGASGMPSGVSVAFDPSSMIDGVTTTQMTVTVPNGTTLGGPTPITLTISGSGVSDDTETYNLTVTPAPTIALDASVKNFGATAGGASPSNQTVAVTNSGSGTLTGLSVSIVDA